MTDAHATTGIPRVSVVVATFEPVRELLRVALCSALAQTFTDFEIVLSVDGDAATAENLVAELDDRRLRLLRNTTRPGAWSNHRFALRAARAPCIAILNHDDVWEPDFLQSLVPVLERDPDLVLAFCDHWIIDARGTRLADETEHNSRRWGRSALRRGVHGDLVALCVRQSIPMAVGAVFRRGALDESLVADEAGPAYDLWLTYALARARGAAHYEPTRLTSWRTHPHGHTTAGSTDWALGSALCWERIAAEPRFEAYRYEAQSRAAAAFCLAATHTLRRRRRAEARAHAQRSLHHRVGPRAAAAWLATWLPGAVVSRTLNA